MLFINTQNDSQKKIFTKFPSQKKSFKLIFIAILILSFAASLTNSKEEKQTQNKTDTQFESRVVELDDSNFTEFNKTNTKFYLYLYEDNCKKCIKFSAQFDKSSFLAQDKFGVKFAKANLDKSPLLRKHYSIHRLPEVFWANYEEQDFHEYPGRLAPKALVKFINSQLNYTSEELQTWEQLEQKRKSGKYAVFVGDIQKFQKAYERFVKVARDEEIDVIMWTKSADLLRKFNVAAGNFDAVLINKRKKSGVEIVANLGINESTTVSDVERLMEIYERKPYAKMNEHSLLLSVEKDSPTPTLFLLYSTKNKTQSSSEYNSQISRDLSKLAIKYRREFHFINASLSSKKLIKPIMNTFNLSADNAPLLLLISDNQEYNDDVDKYVFPADKLQINEQNVEQFLADFKAQKLPKLIFSESLPENSTDENGVFHLVGSNYEDFLFRNTEKDIALMLYGHFSLVNGEIYERFTHVTNKLKNNGNLLFAIANPIFNEIRHLAYDTLPTLFVIKGRNYQERIKNVVRFDSEALAYDTLGMIEFIKANVANAISTVEALEDEDKIFEAQKENVLSPVPIKNEEELIDFDEYNAGLRRYVRDLMDEDDEEEYEEEYEEEINEQPPKKTKGDKKRRNEDL